MLQTLKDTSRGSPGYLGKLKDKMLLLGHRDYPDACIEIAQIIGEGTKVRKRE